MQRTGLTIPILLVALLTTNLVAASPHFLMILPGTTEPKTSDYIVEEGEKKTFWLLWGHPYEHVLFDCPKPERVWILNPEGGAKELTPQPIRVEGVQAWQVSHTFTKPGDYLLCVELREEDHGVWDYVKTVIHCDGEVWEGWNQQTGEKIDLIPYVRPYGIEEGFNFSGKALYEGKPLGNTVVEVEKYHPKNVAETVVREAEKRFHPDPAQMYTRVVTTNETGEFSFTLDESGIWYIAAYGPEEEGLETRAVLQVAVTESFPAPRLSTELENRISRLEDSIKTLETMGAKGFSPGLVYLAVVLSLIAIVLGFAAFAALKRR